MHLHGVFNPHGAVLLPHNVRTMCKYTAFSPKKQEKIAAKLPKVHFRLPRIFRQIYGWTHADVQRGGWHSHCTPLSNLRRACGKRRFAGAVTKSPV